MIATSKLVKLVRRRTYELIREGRVLMGSVVQSPVYQERAEP